MSHSKESKLTTRLVRVSESQVREELLNNPSYFRQQALCNYAVTLSISVDIPD